MFIELLRNRRSRRKFEDRPVEKEKIDLLVEAALRSPSSKGINPWEFVVVTDPEIIARLAAAKPHGAGTIPARACSRRASHAVFARTGRPPRRPAT